MYVKGPDRGKMSWQASIAIPWIIGIDIESSDFLRVGTMCGRQDVALGNQGTSTTGKIKVSVAFVHQHYEIRHARGRMILTTDNPKEVLVLGQVDWIRHNIIWTLGFNGLPAIPPFFFFFHSSTMIEESLIVIVSCSSQIMGMLVSFSCRSNWI